MRAGRSVGIFETISARAPLFWTKQKNFSVDKGF